MAEVLEKVRPSEKLQISWRDQIFELRDRLLQNAQFRSWAIRFPLTRPLARRRAKALFDLTAGFVYSQILLACTQLNVFGILQDGPQDLDSLARHLGLTEPATARLIKGAVALKLLERRGGGRYGLGPLGLAMVDNPGLAAMIEHHRLLYADLAEPVELLRDEKSAGNLASYWPYAREDRPTRLAPKAVQAYSRLMSVSQALIAEEVCRAYGFDRHACLLDVGGGEGAFVKSIASRTDALRFVVFDLPAVAERARSALGAAGLSDRARTVGGDFTADPLPAGADIATLIRIIHDQDDAEACALLQAVRRALVPGGTVLIAEPMAETPGAEPVGDGYFGFYLLAMGRGRPRPPSELKIMLRTAGFESPRLISTHMPMFARVIVAKTPKSE